MRIRRDAYLNTPATGLVHAGDCVVEESDGVVERVAFRYRAAYLDRPGAFSVDPVALLKDRRSQRDRGRAFRYDDIAELVRRRSTRVRVDIPAVVRLMTFNRAINNTDDHERNFSLIHRGEPAYDLTPSLAMGEYHAAGFGYEPAPPSPRALAAGGRVFGLGKPEVRRCAEEVMAAIGRWPELRSRRVWTKKKRLVLRAAFPRRRQRSSPRPVMR